MMGPSGVWITGVSSQLLFGDGSDGALVFSVANNRWEDGNGNAIVTEAGKWTVAGTTLTYLRKLQLTSLTFGTGANLIAGRSGTGFFEFPEILCQSKILVPSDIGEWTSFLVGVNSNSAHMFTPGAAKTTVGNGNQVDQVSTIYQAFGGRGGTSGKGGGDGTNNGGANRTNAAETGGYYPWSFRDGFSTSVGTTGAGANGSNGLSISSDSNISYFRIPLMPSGWGMGGGSGALKVAGGSNEGGAGGAGGYPRMPLLIRCLEFEAEANANVHAKGENGSNGTKGTASNADGDISGGGGGGSGSGGGVIGICAKVITIGSGACSVTGGTGGTGGAGEERVAGVTQARATSNGGNGGNGSDGFVIQELV